MRLWAGRAPGRGTGARVQHGYRLAVAAGSLGLFEVLPERAPRGHSESVATRHPRRAPGEGLVSACPEGAVVRWGAGDSQAERTRGRPDLSGVVCGVGPTAGTAGGPCQACAVADPPPRLVPAPIGQAIHRLLLIQAFRPDRLLAMAHTFVSTNLGESFMSIMEQPLDLTHIVDTEVGTELPVCTGPHRALPLDGHAVGGPPPHQSPTPRSAGQAEHARPDVLCARVRCQRARGGPCR